jgi:hypothetical protein
VCSSDLSTLSTKVNTVSTTVISTLSTVPYARLNDGSQFGNAPIFGARAWVNFNGLSSLATLVSSEYQCVIRGKGNVSKVVWVSPGVYNVHFETALPSENYAIIGSVEVEGTLENFIPRITQSAAVSARVNTQRASIFEDASEIHALFIM